MPKKTKTTVGTGLGQGLGVALWPTDSTSQGDQVPSGMNQDRFSGAWEQFRGDLKKQWDKLTDDDIRQIEGDYDKFQDKLQKRYGPRNEEIQRWSDEWYKRNASTSSGGETKVSTDGSTASIAAIHREFNRQATQEENTKERASQNIGVDRAKPRPGNVSHTEVAATLPTFISFDAEISQQTTEGLLVILAELVYKRVETVYLLISTHGGSVTNSITIYNALRGMPFKLITHNVGNVDSIGNVVFLAGEERYACPNTTFMFHGVDATAGGVTQLSERDLREKLAIVQADQHRIASIIAQRTSIKAQDIERFFLDAVTKDPSYAKVNGIIHDIREVKIPAGASMVQMSFKR
jgi:ATP-dependent Clp protease protease subunit